MSFLVSKKLTKKDLLKKLTKKDRRDARGRIGREGRKSQGARSAPRWRNVRIKEGRGNAADGILKNSKYSYLKNLLKKIWFFSFLVSKKLTKKTY